MSNVAFDQIDWYGSQAPSLTDSEWGKFRADIGTASSIWFINVLANAGGSDAWVVRNMPTLSSSTGEPTQPFSTVFDLGLLGITRGTNLTSLDYRLIIDSTSRTSAPPSGSMTTISVGTAVRDAEGKGTGPTSDPGSPPDVSSLDFSFSFLDFDFIWHFDVPNLDLDNGTFPGDLNACGPAAAANSLVWLGASNGVFVDVSDAMDRPAGEAVLDDKFLAGKLKYIRQKKLGFVVKFMDDELGQGDFHTSYGRAYALGTVPDFAFIEQELDDDEDVELGMTFFQCTQCDGGIDGGDPCSANSECDLNDPGDMNGGCAPLGFGCETNGECPMGSECRASGGHWVTVVGSLDIGLAEGVWTKDDADQSNGGGTETTWSWLVERDDGFLEVTGFPRNQVDIVVSESPRDFAPALGPLGLGVFVLILGGSSALLLGRRSPRVGRG